MKMTRLWTINVNYKLNRLYCLMKQHLAQKNHLKNVYIHL